MRISNTPLKTRISKFVQNIKYERKQKFLDKYCRISDDIEGDAYVKLDSTRETIANYAKSKGVTIDIQSAKRLLDETDSPIIENKLSDKLTVSVADILSGKSENRIISARTDVTHPHIVYKYTLIDYPKDGVQKIKKEPRHYFGDTFLRLLYRNISDMMNSLNSKK